MGQSFPTDTIKNFSLTYEITYPLPMSKLVIKIRNDGSSNLLFKVRNNETKIFDTISYKTIKSDFNTFRQVKETILELSNGLNDEIINDKQTSDGGNYNLRFDYNGKSNKFNGYSRVSKDNNFAELHNFILSFFGYFAQDYEN